jgi:hypothetical protein
MIEEMSFSFEKETVYTKRANWIVLSFVPFCNVITSDAKRGGNVYESFWQSETESKTHQKKKASGITKKFNTRIIFGYYDSNSDDTGHLFQLYCPQCGGLFQSGFQEPVGNI